MYRVHHNLQICLSIISSGAIFEGQGVSDKGEKPKFFKITNHKIGPGDNILTNSRARSKNRRFQASWANLARLRPLP